MNNIISFIIFWLIAQWCIMYYIRIPGFSSIFQLLPLLLLIKLPDRQFRNIVFFKPCLFFVLLTIYQMANCYFQVPSSDLANSSGLSTHSGIWGAVMPNPLLLCLIPFAMQNNKKKTLNYVFWGYIVYIVLGVIIMKTTGDASNRMKNGSIHPNVVAQSCGMGLMFLAYYKELYNITYKKLFLLSVIPIFGIIISTSRNGLLLVAFFVMTVFLAQFFKKGEISRRLFHILIICLLALFFGNYILNNTEIGTRMLETDDTVVSELKTGTVLDLLGERAWYYYIGWLNFLDNPIFGIGLWHFDSYNGGFGFPLHTEYMIHLTEGGIIGAFLYFCFLFYSLKYIIAAFIHEKNAINFTTLMMFLSYMFVGITAREFYNQFFYPVLGVCMYQAMLYYKSNKNDKHKRRIA